jgi:hypothetical protein
MRITYEAHDEGIVNIYLEFFVIVQFEKCYNL